MTDLSALSHDAFYELVNADVRDTLDPTTKMALRDPANVDRWYGCLLSMKRSVEAQMTAAAAELATQRSLLLAEPDGEQRWWKARSESAKWKQGAVRFRNGVEDRIAEAKTIRRAAHAERPLSVLYREQRRLLSDLSRLHQAIATHRTVVNNNPDDTEDADLALWSVLE